MCFFRVTCAQEWHFCEKMSFFYTFPSRKKTTEISNWECFLWEEVFVLPRCATVDGRNPAPIGMYKALYIMRNYLSNDAGFLPSTVSSLLFMISCLFSFPFSWGDDCSNIHGEVFLQASGG